MASLLAGIQHNGSLVSLNVAGNKVNLDSPKMLRLVTSLSLNFLSQRGRGV